MQVGILKTDNGPHSAADWAEATSGFIFTIAENISGEKRTSALKLQAAVVDILEKHHDAVQAGERLFIESEHYHGANDLAIHEHTDLDEAVDEIIKAGQATPWVAEFSAPEMPGKIRDILVSHLASNMHIERSWHADRNPEHPAAIKFKSTFHPGATPAVADDSAASAGEGAA